MSAEPLDLAAALPPDVLAAALAALADAPGTRERALAAVCAAHPDHAATLRLLLADLAAVERLLGGGEGGGDTPPRIGPYRVVRRLGGGAFGEVFLCEQQEPVRRQVAVKVLRAGAGDRTTLLRFATERQLIASLQHPAIAQVFDAGTLADGRPFFVMDAIDGTPLDRYCDERALDVEARIELFCEVCRGVQHAHERGIVHRDLKPANVLVVEIDGRPRPKVIDFGISKVLQTSRVPRPFDTEAGRVVGTPGYMSPEQQSGASDDVDARADVFGLGVMLYELLCGRLPWLAGAAATDTEPQRPSTRVCDGAGTATATARRSATATRRLANRLRGDLDWIALKCLQRDRERRYQTAQELIDDLERHQRAEPVRAGPPSMSYRLRKFVRRHRTAVRALAAAGVVAAAGLVLAEWYRRDASERVVAAAARADASFADAVDAVAVLVERANDPVVREAPQGDAARESMLRDALGFFDRFRAERPADPGLRLPRCRALLGLAHVYWLVGDAPRGLAAADAALREATALRDAEPACVDHRGLLGEAFLRLGTAQSLAGDKAAARTSFLAAVAHLETVAATMPAHYGCNLVIAMRNAAVMLPLESLDERLQGQRATLRLLESLQSVAPTVPGLAREHVLTACSLAEDLHVANRPAEAEAVLQHADARLAELTAVTDQRLHLTYRVNLLRAKIAFQADDRQRALAHYQGALAAATAWEQAQPRRLLPRTSHATVLRDLAFTQNYEGDFARSVESFRQAVAVCDAMVADYPTDPTRKSDLQDTLHDFAYTLFDRFQQGVLAEASACAERAVALRAEGTAPSAHWTLLWLQAAIADARVAGGGDRFWPGVEAALVQVGPDDVETSAKDKDALLGSLAGLIRWHLDHDRYHAARSLLGRAEACIARDPKFHVKRTVEIAWLTARLAAGHGDHAACAAAARRAFDARRTWYGGSRAAECLLLAIECASDEPATAAAANEYRQGLAALCRQVRTALDGTVASDPTDPWYVVPWAMAGVHAAELCADAGDATAAMDLLATSLPRLDAVRAAAHADQWDEAAWVDGHLLHALLLGARR